MGRTKWGVIAVIAVALFAACGSKSAIKTGANTSSTRGTTITSPPPPSTDAPTTEATVPPTTAKPNLAVIGSTITLTGQDSGEQVDVTLVRFVNPAAPADQYTTPDAGKHFAAIQFRVKNTGSTPYDDAVGNDVTIVDNLGQTFAATFDDTSAGPSFASGEVKLNPGDVGLGFVTVAVPNAGSTPSKVRWGTDSGYGQTGEWKVGP